MDEDDDGIGPVEDDEDGDPGGVRADAEVLLPYYGIYKTSAPNPIFTAEIYPHRSGNMMKLTVPEHNGGEECRDGDEEIVWELRKPRYLEGKVFNATIRKRSGKRADGSERWPCFELKSVKLQIDKISDVRPWHFVLVWQDEILIFHRVGDWVAPRDRPRGDVPGPIGAGPEDANEDRDADNRMYGPTITIRPFLDVGNTLRISVTHNQHPQKVLYNRP